MTTHYVNAAYYYTLEFNGAQAYVRRTDFQIGAKDKLRRFFLGDNWQQEIDSVDVSSGGAKGGVFFLLADSLELESLRKAIGVKAQARAVWDQLVAEGFISPQGIKTARAKAASKTLALPVSFAPLKLTVSQQQAILKLLGAPNPQRQFVVKGTEDPGRMLFAEYVISRIGKAKVPKSLVLAVDPTRPVGQSTDPAPSMVLLDLLRDPQKRHAGADPDRFDECLSYLVGDPGKPDSYTSFLVLQKQLRGVTWPTDEFVAEEIERFLVKHKLIVMEASIRAHPAFSGLARGDTFRLVEALDTTRCLIGSVVVPQYKQSLQDMAALRLGDGSKITGAHLRALDEILGASRQQLSKYGVDFAGNATISGRWDNLDTALQNIPADDPLKKDFLRIRRRQGMYMQLVMNIAGDPQRMYSLGRALFADLPIGMGDRFEVMNHGNFFFSPARRRVAPGKLKKPMGCIDNDAVLFTYLPEQAEPVKQGFGGIGDYVTQLFKRTPELWPAKEELPTGYKLVSSARILNLNVDEWFEYDFAGSILGNRMPRSVQAHLDARFYAPSDDGNARANSLQLPAWKTAKLEVKRGFCEALKDFQASKLNEYRNVYDHLCNLYTNGASTGPNFDFRAFATRYRYFKLATIDEATWTVRLPAEKSKEWKTFRGERIDILRQVFADQSLSGLIQAALDDSAANMVLQRAAGGKDATPAVTVAALLRSISVNAQEKMLPGPFGPGATWDSLGANRVPASFGEMPYKEKEQTRRDWQALHAAAQRRINVAIAVILGEFLVDALAADPPIAPTWPTEQITKHAAYKRAVALALEFSGAKLGVDGPEKGAQQTRRALWKKYNLAMFAPEV